MHPLLLEATIKQCQEYMEAGDCHGAAPPVERLIAAVVELSHRPDIMASAAVPEHWASDGSPRPGNPLLETEP